MLAIARASVGVASRTRVGALNAARAVEAVAEPSHQRRIVPYVGSLDRRTRTGLIVGAVAVGAIANAGSRRVARLEVSADVGRRWADAELKEPLGRFHSVELEVGR